MGYKETPSEVDAEVLGCGILSCMSIVSLTILASYLIEGREIVQSTVIDATFCIIAAALLLTSGGTTGCSIKGSFRIFIDNFVLLSTVAVTTVTTYGYE